MRGIVALLLTPLLWFDMSIFDQLPKSPFSYDEFGLPLTTPANNTFAAQYDPYADPNLWSDYPAYSIIDVPTGRTTISSSTPRRTLTQRASSYPIYQSDLDAAKADRGLLSDYARIQPIFDGDPDSHSEPLDPVSNTSFNIADAIFTALGLVNPAFAALSFPFTLARGYDYFFGEDDDVDTAALEAWGIDPKGILGGLGGPPGADDTTEDPTPPQGQPIDPFAVDPTQPPGAPPSAPTGTPPAPPPGPAYGDIGGTVSGPPAGPVGHSAGDPAEFGGGAPPGGGDEGAGGGSADNSGDDEGGPEGDDDEWHLGGLLSGSGPKDITAHGGEYIIRKSAVKKYGRGLFDDLNKSKIGKRQLKGLLDA